MTSKTPPLRPQPPRIHPATRWHRLLGITSAAIVIVTVATGIVLNHGDALGLSGRHAASGIVRSLYGLHAPAPDAVYASALGPVVQVGTRVFIEATTLVERESPLVGVVVVGDGLLLAFADGLVQIDSERRIVDRYDALDGLTTPVLRAGAGDGRAWLESDGGVQAFEADGSLSSGGLPVVGIDWSEAAELTSAQAEALTRAYTGDGVSYERVLLDLHSGRLFGAFGVWIVDAAALCVLVLALTGVFMWFRFRRGANAARAADVRSRLP